MYGWNYLSIQKLPTIATLKFAMDKLFHPTLYNACDYLSMPGIKSIYISKMGPWWRYDRMGALLEKL